MSDIYSFSIRKIEENILTVDAEVVHPDVDWVEDTKNLALQIILEPFSNMEKGYVYNANWQKYPFNKEDAYKMVEGHPLKEQMSYWIQLMRGMEVESSEEEYTLISNDKVDKTNPRYQNMGSYGGGSGGWTISYYPNYKAFMNVSNIAILDVERKDVENMPWAHNQMSWEAREKITDKEWDDMYKNNPTCTLIIKVLNKEILNHLREGTEWNSAMYDFTHYAR